MTLNTSVYDKLDPIDIRDKCLSIIVNELHPGRPYHFKWIGQDMYLFLTEDNSDNQQILNIYITND